MSHVTAQHASSGSSSGYMHNFVNILAPGKEPSMTKEYKPQVAYEREPNLNPQTLKRHVLRSEKMRSIIAEHAALKKSTPKQVEAQVKAIIDEIGLERSLPIIRWCGMAITAIGKRISSGFYINDRSIARIKQHLGRHPVLYLPSHRSYMDFILMSYICFHYDIEIPGIAAGMDFHSMFGMGTMLRKTGAFFMRRSFSDDELYWDVFREYMYALVARYHIGVEFFIEGTRSRNFKSLMPKVGLLSMALLPYFANEVSDITIVPVSISYERLLEEQLFVYELLGVPKPKESTRGFFKALKIIEERFGSMYIDFGEPISVRAFFGHTSIERAPRAAVGAHLQKLHKNEVELVKKLANEVIYQQQRRIVITTFNLISLTYFAQLYADQHALNIDELTVRVSQLKRLFEQLGAHVATNENSIHMEILETVEIHANLVHFRQAQLYCTQVATELLAQQIDRTRLKAHGLVPQTMAVAVPSLALQLYTNPCLFWLVRPAFFILAALQLQQQANAEPVANMLQLIKEKVASLVAIFKSEFIIESSREDEEFEQSLSILQANDVIKINSQQTNLQINQNEYCLPILTALAPYLCVYYQLTLTVNEYSLSETFTAKEVFIKIQERVERCMERQIQKHVHPYCLALDNLNIALQSFVQLGHLSRNKTNGAMQKANESSAAALKNLELELLQYCDLLPFKRYYSHIESESSSGKQEHAFSAKL